MVVDVFKGRRESRDDLATFLGVNAGGGSCLNKFKGDNALRVFWASIACKDKAESRVETQRPPHLNCLFVFPISGLQGNN
jgi:hypothetical protein